MSGGTPWPRFTTCPGAAAAADHVGGVRVQRGVAGEQQRGIDVALQRCPAAEPAVRLVQRDPVVDAHHVRAGVAHGDEQLAGADAEVHARHTESATRRSTRGRVRRDEPR